MPMYILFLILGLLALAGSVYLLVKRLRAFFQDRKAKAVDKKLLLEELIIKLILTARGVKYA